MRFLVDAQLPPKLADWLRSRGHEAEHIAIILGDEIKDGTVIARAMQTGAVIVSKDADFISLLDATTNAPQLLWVRCGNATNRVLIGVFEANWARIESELSTARALVECP